MLLTQQFNRRYTDRKEALQTVTSYLDAAAVAAAKKDHGCELVSFVWCHLGNRNQLQQHVKRCSVKCGEETN